MNKMTNFPQSKGISKKRLWPGSHHTLGLLNHFADVLSLLPQVTSIPLRRYDSDSDYDEILYSESKAEGELQDESLNDDEEVIVRGSLNRDNYDTPEK